MAGLDSAIHVFLFSRLSCVGWAKAPLRRAHHFSRGTMVGTLRFAHP